MKDRDNRAEKIDELLQEKTVLLYELDQLEDLGMVRMLPDVVLDRIDKINRRLHYINTEIAKLGLDRLYPDEL